MITGCVGGAWFGVQVGEISCMGEKLEGYVMCIEAFSTVFEMQYF